MSLNQEQVEEFLHLTRRSLVATGKALFPDLLSLRPSYLHYELSTALVDGQDSMVIAYPREFGKSTFMWELLSAWNVIHHRYRYIMFIGSTTTIAKRMFSTNVVPNIISHPLLKAQIKVTKNTQEEFHYEVNGEKYFMACFGAGQQLRGTRFKEFRPDLIIMDDIETTEATQSADQRDKLWNWLVADVMPLGKEARFFIVGTMLHQDCMLARLMEKPPVDVKTEKEWGVRRYAVIDSEGESVWPEKYSDEWIESKRKEYIKMGALDRWNTEYMNVPVDRSSRMFKPEQLSFYAPDQLQAARSGGMDIIIIVDPGIAKEVHRDPTCIVVSGMDKNNNLWLMDVVNARLSHHEILKEIVRLHKKWLPRMTYIESVQAQIWLFEDLRNGTNPGRDIIPCEKIDGSQIRMGKEVRIQGLDDMFRQKKIFISAEADYIDELVNQMVMFPKAKNDDILDCFPEWTPIITADGVKPIQEVTTADSVLTRNGYKKVIKSWCKGNKEVVSRFGITATPDHRIWTENRGWVSLDELSYDDIILICETQKNLTAGPIIDTQMQNKHSIGDTTSAMTSNTKHQDISTGMFGRIITARSHKGITSTILTETTSTTIPLTSNAYHQNNIGKNTDKSVVKGQKRLNTLSTWTTLDHSHQKPEGLGKIVAVRCADLPSTPRQKEQDSVAENALTSALKGRRESLRNTEQTFYANNVGLSSNQKTMQQNIVVEDVSRKVPVYDIHVEDNHEFFAWGVLVHNCISYAKLNHVRIGGITYDYTPILNGNLQSSTIF